MEAPKKKSKAKRIVLTFVGVFLGLYVVGGTAAGIIVPKILFSTQGKKIDALQTLPFRIYKTREDYPNMATREVYSFSSDGNRFQGYLYGKENTAYTVLHAHGMNLFSDAKEAAIASYYLNHQCRVFMVDLTGSGNSEGNGLGSLSQSVHDVKAAYQFLKNEGLLQGKLVLSGYSWGAHGVSKAFADGIPADKLIAFSGYDSAYEEMVAMAGRRSANISYVTLPTFALGLRISQGEEAFEKASDKLKEKAEKCFFIQGKTDDTVPYSISLARAMEGSKASFYLTEDNHVTPWFSPQARAYFREQVEPNLGKVTKEEEEQFLAKVDKEAMCELDQTLFDRILEFLQRP